MTKPAADPMSETPATPTLIVEVAREDARRVQYAANGHMYCATASPFQAAKVVLAVNSHATLLNQRDALVKALENCPLPSQSAPTGEFYGRFYAWYNGQREAALKVKE